MMDDIFPIKRRVPFLVRMVAIRLEIGDCLTIGVSNCWRKINLSLNHCESKKEINYFFHNK